MKKIKESKNEHHWPRNSVQSVDCRKRDLVIRIADWWDDKEEPSFAVEVYIGGVFDFHESESFTKNEGLTSSGEKCGGYTKAGAKAAAIEFAAVQIKKLL